MLVKTIVHIMPYRTIGADLKQRALWLLANGYILDKVHRILNVSTCSIQCWANNVATYGHILPPLNPLRGRRHSLTAIHIYGLIGIIEASPAMFLDELQD